MTCIAQAGIRCTPAASDNHDLRASLACDMSSATSSAVSGVPGCSSQQLLTSDSFRHAVSMSEAFTGDQLLNELVAIDLIDA